MSAALGIDTPAPAEAFCSTRLETVFNGCFAGTWRTRLLGGADEPFYQPAQRRGEYHVLRYRADFFASALHETAHWCIAGARRRRQVDFGYWYTPEGRDARQQLAFQRVEARPQALEWFFSRACGWRFRVSLDNPQPADTFEFENAAFENSVLEQALALQRSGLQGRPLQFYQALCREFGTAVPAGQLRFSLAELA